MIKGLYNRIFSSTWALTEEESLAYRTSVEGKSADWKTMVIAVWACAALVLIEYVGKDPGYVYIIDLFKGLGLESLSKHLTWYLEKNPLRQLNSLAYWAVVIAVCYLIVPILIIRFIFKEKVSDYGIRKGLLGKDYKLYLGMLCVMIPMVYFFSRTDGFQLRYPFYRMAKGEGLYPNFLIWQVLYLFQFFCLEFFFRGFLVHGLKKRFGYYSVFIMTIPYCMIHFGKPMPETFAAIIAGIILGTLSLKSGTIWMGVLIHYSVAISMDLSALWQKGFWN